jgi:hypothetical protein
LPRRVALETTVDPDFRNVFSIKVETHHGLVGDRKKNSTVPLWRSFRQSKTSDATAVFFFSIVNGQQLQGLAVRAIGGLGRDIRIDQARGCLSIKAFFVGNGPVGRQLYRRNGRFLPGCDKPRGLCLIYTKSRGIYMKNGFSLIVILDAIF